MDKQDNKKESNISVLMNEYNNGISIGEGYANRTYNILYFTLITYAGVMVLSFQEKILIQQEMIYFFFLPVISYILGLFYVYNSFVIMRQSYYMIRLEILIRLSFYEENKRVCNLQGWNIFSKYYDGHYILAYGTVLIFYFGLPLFDFLYGLNLRDWQIYIDFANYKMVNIILSYLPFIMYLCFAIFAVLIILRTVSLHREMQKNGVSYKMGDISFVARVKLNKKKSESL